MQSFSVGHRFLPTPAKLLGYLMRMVTATPQPLHCIIVEKDLYSESSTPWKLFSDEDPWQFLDEGDAGEDKEKMAVYVFTRLKKLGKKGGTKNVVRTAGCGTWSGQTGDKPIFFEGRKIGSWKMLSYKVKEGEENGAVGHWIMHEYALSDESLADIGLSSTDYVVCKIIKKGGGCLGSNTKSMDYVGRGVEDSEAAVMPMELMYPDCFQPPAAVQPAIPDPATAASAGYFPVMSMKSMYHDCFQPPAVQPANPDPATAASAGYFPIAPGAPQPLEFNENEWITLDELDQYMSKDDGSLGSSDISKNGTGGQFGPSYFSTAHGDVQPLEFNENELFSLEELNQLLGSSEIPRDGTGGQFAPSNGTGCGGGGC